jgi:hypothetical protein
MGQFAGLVFEFNGVYVHDPPFVLTRTSSIHTLRRRPPVIRGRLGCSSSDQRLAADFKISQAGPLRALPDPTDADDARANPYVTWTHPGAAGYDIGIGEAMYFTSQTMISGLFGNEAAIYVVLTVVGLAMVAIFAVGLIVLVLKNLNREWPIR